MKLWHVYVLIGVVALFATGSQGYSYLAEAGPFAGTVDFWRDALAANDASRFLVFDVVLLALAVFVLMWVEAHKVGISTGWFVGYVLLSVFVGISTFGPFFLAHRQRLLDAQAT